jgi:outer membrane protein insertion porin family
MARLGVVLLIVACAVLRVPAAVAYAQAADPLEGLVVREIRVTGVQRLPAHEVTRHLATRVGDAFRRSRLAVDRRRLDELRLFTSVAIDPRLEAGAVVVEVAVSETLRLLPVVLIRVTDENGVSVGPGMRAVNLMGGGAQAGAAAMFGGETSATVAVDATTITPGTWAWHLGFSHSSRRNAVYEFDERATAVDGRFGRNVNHGLRIGATTSLRMFDTGTSGPALSADGLDVIPALGAFVTFDTLDSSTNPRLGTWTEVEVERLTGDARSWTVTLDGRRFQPIAARHGLGLFALATWQSGDVGVSLPEYLQFSLGGANSVRGWRLGTRLGRHQFISGVEYTYVVHPVTPFSVAGLHFYGGLQLAAFADLGLAWNGRDDFDTSRAIDGYGIGLRLLVPFVDVIRLDVAWGEPGQGAVGYFGVSLKPARQRQRVR